MGFRVAVKIFAIFAISSAACGTEPPKPVEPAELAELCGQTEPIRLLGYAPGREVTYASHIGVFGDRRLLYVYHSDTNVAPQVVWSTGLCGEAPQRLFSGKLNVWTVPGQPWPFVCEWETGELHVIDPTGERAAKHIATLPVGCDVRGLHSGLFGIRRHDDESVNGDLTAWLWPDDVWTDDINPVIIADAKTFLANPHQSPYDALQGSEDELFFVTANDELMRMSVAELELELVATDVRVFGVGHELDDSEQGYWPRYLIWQDIELSNDDPELPEGEILILDRATNQQSSLGHAMLTAAQLRATNWSTSGLLQLPVRVDDELVLRLFQLPSLSYVDVPATLEPRFMLADDRHLVVRIGEDGPSGTLDVLTGEVVSFTSYFSNPGHSYWHEIRASALLPAAGDGKIFAEGQLWLVDGGDPPELFAERATFHHRLMPDARLLTGINLDDRAVGDLIVVDDFEERLVDQGAQTSFLAVGPRIGDDLVGYSILDDDRAGYWLARLQPRE